MMDEIAAGRYTPDHWEFGPNCSALYRLVRAEAGPESGDREIACRSCGAPRGRFILKYFLIERANDRKQRSRHLTQKNPRLSRDRHINCDRLSLPAAGKRQCQEVEVVFEEDSGGKSLKLLREFSNDTIGPALKRCRETLHHLCNTRE
jgi:hypothetical protein